MSVLVEKQTAGLTGPALDWAVAQAAGFVVELAAPQYGNPWRPFLPGGNGQRFAPSENWSQGGPLIEAHSIGHGPVGYAWAAYVRRSNGRIDLLFANSPLIACCRAVVADRFGAVVSIPGELA